MLVAVNHRPNNTRINKQTAGRGQIRAECHPALCVGGKTATEKGVGKATECRKPGRNEKKKIYGSAGA